MIVEADETFDINPEYNADFLLPDEIWDNTDCRRSDMETYQTIIVYDDDGTELYRVSG